MAEYNAAQASFSQGSVGVGAVAAARERSPRQGVPTALAVPAAAALSGTLVTTVAAVIVNEFNAADWDTGIGVHWFEDIHYTPQSVDVGNLLSTVTQPVEIYNAFRGTSQTLTDADITDLPGVTFSGLPVLPYEIPAQSGALFDAVISIDGPPTIDGTLDFVTDVYGFSIAIIGSRVVTFAYQPESPIVETLEWNTKILTGRDGTEQRISWRKNPRQLAEMIVRADGSDRRKMLNLLRGWQGRVFGLPIWWEANPLQNSFSAGIIALVDTDYADYRVGGLALIWESPDKWDAVEIATVNDGSLIFTSGTLNAYTAGEALVMPLRTAYQTATIDMQTHLNNLQDVRLRWTVIDNDVGSLADTSAFGTHNSKVLLDDGNRADGPMRDGFERTLEIIDNEIASPVQFTDQLASVPVTNKGFWGGSRQAVWQVRQLVHALRGSQVSFYLPTFFEDLIVTQDLTVSSTDLNIEHVGYTDFINGVEPNRSVWIELVDGTVITREVTGSIVIDSDNERLTVDSAWASTVPVADISRVSILQLVRIADDRVRFAHEYPGSASINMAVRGAP